MVSSVCSAQPSEVAMPLAAEALTRTGLNLPSTIQQWMSMWCLVGDKQKGVSD
jgi:hypothetical protein